MIKITNPNPMIYIIMLKIPIAKLVGKILEMMSAYVGEQDANIGPNDAPKRTSDRNQLFCSFFIVWVFFEGKSDLQ